MISTMGDFEISEQIGEGGMSTVYLARQVSLGRKAAIKVLKDALAADTSFVKRFLREAKSAAALSHPNIVQIYSAGTYEKHNYIAMEYVDGTNLSELLKRFPCLSQEDALDICIKVSDALACAAASNIVHRDIKPANIMIAEGDRIKVADFGLAKCFTDDTEHLTREGKVLGTVTYMSPEQGLGEPADSRSDIYSLGVVLFELLAGRPPFKGDHPTSIIYRHVYESAPPVSFYNRGVCPDIESLIFRMMAKKADDRPQTFGELLGEFEAIRKRHGLYKERSTPIGTSARKKVEKVLHPAAVTPRNEQAYVPRCLIVDDDDDLSELCMRVAGSLGFSVMIARDGVEALTLWKERSPDLVVLDLKMPRLGGMAVLEEWKEEKLGGKVLVTSVKSDWDTIRHAMTFGISGYLMKPYSPDSLTRKVSEIIGTAVH